MRIGLTFDEYIDLKLRPHSRVDRVGWNWRIPAATNERPIQHVTFDSNFWKSFIQARLAVPQGDRGGLSLFGSSESQHRLLAEHLTAEYRVPTSGRGRTVDEWKVRPGQPDNHWLDCLVGAAVAASIEGVSLLGEKPVGNEKRKTFKVPEHLIRNRPQYF